MTILLVSQVFPPKHGGSGRWLWELYRRLTRVSVRVAAGNTPGDGRFDHTASLPIARLSLDFASWGLMNPRGAWQYARALTTLHRMAGRLRPDEVHCGKCLPEGLLGLALKYTRGRGYCVYVHGEELTLAATSRELRTLTRVVLHRADRLVANSRNTRQMLLDDWGIAQEHVVVMHPGVDTDTFRPATPDPARRAQLGWTDRRVVLTVGALQKRKGQDMMIRALPRIRQACPDVLYAVAGMGPDRQYLLDLVKETGTEDAVQFLGAPSEDDLVSLYQQCDLFALPNRRIGWDLEGFGIVTMEAQACGKAVVVGDSGGSPETVQRSVTGEVIACDTPDLVATTVTELLNDPERRAAMGVNGRAWAVEHFDWRSLASAADALFVVPASRRPTNL